MSIQKFSGNYRTLDSGSVLVWSPEESINFCLALSELGVRNEELGIIA